ncbi:hypothetical protein [Mycobacterium sp. D16R24]|uniref:hypothetical protein n=1 Tax=Mycobacterium sp. D16R24 TaxID=1855656 RepID=UPI000993C454|nr:hypothetical protein [Mycobacterium sp. D16R24]
MGRSVDYMCPTRELRCALDGVLSRCYQRQPAVIVGDEIGDRYGERFGDVEESFKEQARQTRQQRIE